MELTEEEKGVLILGARDSIQSYFGNSLPPIIEYEYYPNLKKTDAGAFVTLLLSNNLRGCIGYITSKMTLFETVCDAAKQAAFNDPRFVPLTEEEVAYVNIEISVLSPLEPINSYDDIEIGKHGLVLEYDKYRSVLLPQVAAENEFTVPQFLEALCQKAGLPADTWQRENLDIKVFTAFVFSELGKRKRTYEGI